MPILWRDSDEPPTPISNILGGAFLLLLVAFILWAIVTPF